MREGDCPSLRVVLQQIKVTLRKIRILNGNKGSESKVKCGTKAKVRGNH